MNKAYKSCVSTNMPKNKVGRSEHHFIFHLFSFVENMSKMQLSVSPVPETEDNEVKNIKGVKVNSMQRSGTEAIRTQIQPSKPKWE